MKEQDRQGIGSLMPMITEFELPFWNAFAQGRLLIQKCNKCGKTQFPPSPVCTDCLSDDVGWIEASGELTLWSKVWFHKQYLPQYPDTPYAVITARLKEGPFITGRMAVEEAKTADFDTPLEMEFVKTSDGTNLICFKEK